jgi:hypothetical protein
MAVAIAVAQCQAPSDGIEISPGVFAEGSMVVPSAGPRIVGMPENPEPLFDPMVAVYGDTAASSATATVAMVGPPTIDLDHAAPSPDDRVWDELLAAPSVGGGAVVAEIRERGYILWSMAGPSGSSGLRVGLPFPAAIAAGGTKDDI